ncbi:MAG: MreB/Mrl family cell shape determining protein [Nitrospiraceae bacterium]|nr:MreB/Mrl family cell shape determining protein [Nitrospiraceae bacterium]
MFAKKIGIDLGTTNILVYLPKKGVVINEPSVITVSVDDNRILAVGKKAKEMLGKTPDGITAIRPMRDGVIADYRVTEAMLRYFINEAGGKIRFFQPEVLISAPAGITSTERRAIIDASSQAGAKNTYIVKEPILAAIGAGIPINTPSGNMIIDIGGGTTEVAIISLGGIVSSSSVRIGGNKLDKAIIDYIKKKHSLAVGDRVAESVKISIGGAFPREEEKMMEVKGRDLISGLPKTIQISSSEVTEAIHEQLLGIVQAVKLVLQETPPELVADVIDRGMVLSGGGALLKDLDKLIADAIEVPCHIADDPLLCVAKGTGVMLNNLELYKKSVMGKRN